MNDPLNTALVFGFLSLLHLWGGAAIGTGARARRPLLGMWGLLVGGLPLYFGIERVIVLGSWGGLLWQVLCLAGSALAVGLRLTRLRAWLLREGMTAVMVGTFLMSAGALLGAWLFRYGLEVLSIGAGGIGFLLGAMWFGSGLRQLRGKP